MRILAHRGLESEFVPENTIKAFADAIAAEADVIETDIQVTADSVPVIFHDDSLSRMAGIDRLVSDCTLAELATIDIGSAKRIPSLEQALLAFPETKFNLDIKTDGAAEPTALVIEKLSAHSRVLISSFSEKRRLSVLAMLSRPTRTSAGVSKVLKLYLAHLLGMKKIFIRIAAGSDSLQIPTRKGILKLDSPSFIAMAHEANLEVHYWTINDSKEMLRLRSIGADGIVTDHCDLAVATLR